MTTLNIHAHKTGGAAFATAERFDSFAENIARPILSTSNSILAVSAMPNVTRILVSLNEAKVAKKARIIKEKFDELRETHETILNELFTENHPIWHDYHMFLLNLNKDLQSPAMAYVNTYAKVLKCGEMLCSHILSAHLKQKGIPNIRKDAREMIKTRNTNGYVRILEPPSAKLVQNLRPDFTGNTLIITEGFIGRDYDTGENSVLAFNGSDESGGFFANALDAKSLTFWKDVLGVSKFDDPTPEQKLIIESDMTYKAYDDRFEGKLIYPVYPKGIRYAASKNIPVYVRSFFNLSNPGTLIH